MGAELKVSKNDPIIVVEGPRDFFKIRSLGYDNVRATLGSKPSDWQAETLASYGKDIVPLYDEDNAGKAGRRELRKQLKGRCKVLSFRFPESAIDPESGKSDPAMLTKETFGELLESFKDVYDFSFGLSRTRNKVSP